MGRYGIDPVIKLGWFVCPTVVPTYPSKAASLEKALFMWGFFDNTDEFIFSIVVLAGRSIHPWHWCPADIPTFLSFGFVP